MTKTQQHLHDTDWAKTGNATYQRHDGATLRKTGTGAWHGAWELFSAAGDPVIGRNGMQVRSRKLWLAKAGAEAEYPA